MNKSLKLFLQSLVVFTGISVCTFMLWEPHLEGRNANATVFQIYFNDPFLAFAYIGSIPFFVALYRVFKIIGNANKESVVKSLRTIKYCAMILIGFVLLGEVFILSSQTDDHAGGVFIGVFITVLCSLVIASVRLLEKRYNLITLKLENR